MMKNHLLVSVMNGSESSLIFEREVFLGCLWRGVIRGMQISDQFLFLPNPSIRQYFCSNNNNNNRLYLKRVKHLTVVQDTDDSVALKTVTSIDATTNNKSETTTTTGKRSIKVQR